MDRVARQLELISDHQDVCWLQLAMHQVAAVQSAARALGIATARGRLDPAQKLALLEEQQARGARVLMVGDGINDGPVLAAAYVSCAMGEGSAVAHAASDLLLLNPSFAVIAETIRTARRSAAVVRENLAWALVYNLTAVPLAALAWVPPWAAALGMSVSSLVVVLNAARLARVPRSGRASHEPRVPRALEAPGAAS